MTRIFAGFDSQLRLQIVTDRLSRPAATPLTGTVTAGFFFSPMNIPPFSLVPLTYGRWRIVRNDLDWLDLDGNPEGYSDFW